MRIPFWRLLCTGLHIKSWFFKKQELFGFLNIDSAKQPILTVKTKWLDFEFALDTDSVSQLLHGVRN